MAIATLSPDTDPAIPDPVTFEEAAGLFLQTGRKEFTDPSLRNLVNKLQRWAKEDGLYVERRGRKDRVSWSDLLVAHASRCTAPRIR